MDFNTLSSVYADEYAYITALFSANNIQYSQNELLDLLICVDNAWRAIASYLWIDYDSTNIATVKSDYKYLIAKLAMAYFQNAKVDKNTLKGNLFIQQQSQGSRSVSFRSNVIELDSHGLTAEVKAALPTPKLRVI